MPHTITYSSLAQVLPPQRLAMYEKVFHTSDPIELHGTYIWSLKVAAGLPPLLSSLEVALRNSIHSTASNIIAPDWYDQLSTKIRKSWQTKKRDIANIQWHNQEIERVKRKISKKKPPKGLNKHDLLVAKMDFGFWDNLLKECFSINGDHQALWPQCIPTVFPNLPKGHTNASIQQEVSILRELRNNIAHNSPVWKHKQVTDSATAIHYINQLINKVVEIISWLSTEKVNWLEVHLLQSEAQRLASKDYLQLCQRKNLSRLSQHYSPYKREFRRNLKHLDKTGFDLITTSDSRLYMVTQVSDKADDIK